MHKKYKVGSIVKLNTKKHFSDNAEYIIDVVKREPEHNYSMYINKPLIIHKLMNGFGSYDIEIMPLGKISSSNGLALNWEDILPFKDKPKGIWA